MLALMMGTVLAAGTVEVGKSYQLEGDLLVRECGIPGTGVDAVGMANPKYTTVAKANYKFVLIDTEGDESLIRLLKFKSDTATAKWNRADGKEKYWCAETGDLKVLAVRTYGVGKSGFSPATGLLAMPVKLRPSFSETRLDENGNEYEYNASFDFATDFSLGPAIGFRYRFAPKKEHFLMVVGSAGVGAVTVSPDNSTLEFNDGESTRTMASFSPAGGVVLDFAGFQFGALVGGDWIGGESGKAWDHQGRPWVGIGVGVGIFGGNTKSNATSQKKLTI